MPRSAGELEALRQADRARVPEALERQVESRVERRLTAGMDRRVATEVARKIKKILEQQKLRRHRMFGRGSEAHAGKGRLFNEAELEAPADSQAEAGEDAASPDTRQTHQPGKNAQKRRRGQRPALPLALPRVEHKESDKLPASSSYMWVQRGGPPDQPVILFDYDPSHSGAAIDTAASMNLKPWHEVVTPHKDVASGRYQQAEFAADPWQVHLGEGTAEYCDPVEFFRRTYLTESLKGMLVGAVTRLAGQGGDPVVQLQTNFGGRKTHSMLGLYHLFSGAGFNDLADADGVMEEAELEALLSARRVVLVGNKISPGNPDTKPVGTVVRTLWGDWPGSSAASRVRALVHP